MKTRVQYLALAGIVAACAGGVVLYETHLRHLIEQPTATDAKTLCEHIYRSIPEGHCTVVAAQAAFQVGSLVAIDAQVEGKTVGQAEGEHAKPIAATQRDLVRGCWLRPASAGTVARDVVRPAQPLTMAAYTAGVPRDTQTDAPIVLHEGFDLALKAGANVANLKSISVQPANAHIQQVDMVALAGWLKKDDVRQDCVEALGKPGTRLVTAVITADGLNYKVGTNDNHTLTLSAALDAGLLSLDVPKAKLRSHDDQSTTIEFDAPKVIAVVLADKSAVARLAGVVKPGSLVRTVEAAQPNATTLRIRNPGGIMTDQLKAAQMAPAQIGLGTGGNGAVASASGGPAAAAASIVTASTARDGRERYLAHVKQALPAGAEQAVDNVRYPTVSGELTTVAKPVAEGHRAAQTLKASLEIVPGGLDAQIAARKAGTPAAPEAPAQPVRIVSTVETETVLRGEFDVFKRGTGPERIVVAVSPPATAASGAVIIRVRGVTDPSIEATEAFAIDKLAGPREYVHAVATPGIYHVTAELRLSKGAAEAPQKLEQALDVAVTIQE